MQETIKIILILLLPFLGTVIGSLPSLFIPKNNDKLLNVLFGFSAGIMLAASIWSLLIPSVELSTVQPKFLMAVIGYLFGLALMLIVENVGLKGEKTDKFSNMVFAINVHNFPEGMSVGVCLAGMIGGKIGFGVPLSLAFGIAIQNIPEGSIVALPLASGGKGRKKAVLACVISGLFEFFGAIIALLVTSFATSMLPFMLSFSAGAMQWVVFRELVPEAKTKLATICCGIGFLIMMVLDVAFS